MLRKYILIPILLFIFSFQSLSLLHAQEDGLNLPAELYTLVNDGRVERYGLGASGVSAVTPDATVVIDFGVAPDGIWLAYRTENSLMLHNMLTGDASEIEGATAGVPPYRGRGATLAWSPDGTALAYAVEYGLRFRFDNNTFFDMPITPIINLMWSPTGTYLAAEAENNIWWVYKREGNQMILISAIPSSIGLAWVSDGLMMFAPETGGLFLMDVSNGNAQSQISDENLLFRLPVFRRDGTVSVFARPANDTTFLPTQGFLYRVSPAGDNVGIEQISTIAVDFNNLRWSPDGNLLLTLSSGILGLVDGATGQGFSLPVTGIVTYGWGAPRPTPAPTLALTSTGYFLADDGTGVEQLWLTADDAALAVQVLAAESSLTTYAIAPDGETIAYHRDGQLWLLPATADLATSILTIDEVNNLGFSADGSALIYDADGNIYSVPVEGGEPQQLLAQYSEPAYSPNGTALLVRIGDGDLGLLIVESGEVRRLGAFAWGKWLANGQLAIYGAPVAGTQPGVYIVDLNTDGTPRLLYASSPGERVLDVAASGNNLRILETKIVTGPAALEAVQIPLAGGELTNLGSPGFIGDPVLSPDGRFVAGYASAAGTIVIYDLDTDAERVLLQPPRTHDFQWR